MYSIARLWKGWQWNTALHTTRGDYEYLILPYSLTNVPTVFQPFINEIIVYIDAILIYSSTYEDHAKQVCTMLTSQSTTKTLSPS